MSDKWQFAIQEIDSLKELIGKNLSHWRVEEIYEVRQSDCEGRSSTPIGYFRDSNVAEAFANPENKVDGKSVKKVVVLTDGKAAFLFNSIKPLDMFDDEVEAARLRASILSKLTPAEQKLMRM